MKKTVRCPLALAIVLILAPARAEVAFAQRFGFIAGLTPSSPNPSPQIKRCRPEGARSHDPGRCCSLTTFGGICCATGGSCAKSGCCDPASGNPFCHKGTCVPCLPEGVPSEEATFCCSLTTADGVCCGGEEDSCAVSGCCNPSSATPFCHKGNCVACLPEGALGDEASCCSGATTTVPSGICCGEVGASCALSGCCGAGGACDGQTCQPCLVEGSSTSDPAECCSGAAENGVCCGILGDFCGNSGCCAGGLCADSACIPCLPEGEPSDSPDACCSSQTTGGVCCGEENATCMESGCCAAGQTCFQFRCSDCTLEGGECTTQLDCCEGDCCNGTCIPTDFDPENCGACGNTCAEGCCGGVCIPPCPADEILDPDTCECVETCHGLGSPCASDGDCCPGTACCANICTDTSNDKFHCGACENPCLLTGESCQQGECGILCGFSCRNGIPLTPPDLFCPRGTTCTYLCGGDVSTVLCCGSCPPGEGPLGNGVALNCGDGVCCCGTCDPRNNACVP